MTDATALVDQANAEACGPAYDKLMMVETRRRTFDAIRRIGDLIRPGMTEEEGIALTRQVLREDGLLRGWHGINLRFGVNTICTFRDKSVPGIVLGEDDIFFIDIGPVWRDWEGDGGRTDRTSSSGALATIAAVALAPREAGIHKVSPR